MIKFLFLLITILIINLLYVIIFNNKFGKLLPITLITLFFIAFISGLLGNLSYYKFVLPLIMIALIAFIIVKKRNVNTIEKIKNNYFNFSFFCFIFIFFYSWFLFKNVGLSNIDDLFHWSLSVNTIVKSGTLFPVGWYVNTYPPFVTWYISIVCYILGGYNESFCLFALSNLCFSFVYPFLDRFSFKRKDIITFILSFIILLLSYLSINITDFDQFVFVFNSIYIDWIMAILFAYLMFLVYDYSGIQNEAIYFSVVLSSLALTKQVSIPLSLICVFALFIKQLIKKDIKIKNIIFIIILPIAAYVSWSILLGLNSNTSSLSGSINVVSTASSSVLSNDSSKLKIISDFISALFLRPIIFHPIKISYFFFITLLFIIQLVYGVIKKEEKYYFSSTIIFYLGSFGFALVMLISYLVVIPDGYGLPLYSRYMQTYTFAYLLLFIYYFINKNKTFYYFPLLLLVLLLIEPKSINTILINKESRYYKQEEREKINQYISDIYNDNDKIAVLAQTNMKYKGSILFMFYDNHKSKNVSFIQVSDGYLNDLESFKSFLSNYKYILVSDYDKTVGNCWTQITDSPLYNSTLYKIVSEGNDLEIQLVEIFEKTN